jgi:hypothetical protein
MQTITGKNGIISRTVPGLVIDMTKVFDKIGFQ